MKIDSRKILGILRANLSSGQDIDSASVMTRDGIMLASVTPPSTVDKDRLGAMGSSLLSLSDRVASELNRGDIKQTIIHADKGYVVVTGIADFAVLVVSAGSKAKLGKVVLDSNSMVREIAPLRPEGAGADPDS